MATRGPQRPVGQAPFDFGDEVAADAPLAARMRPRTLDEFVGQDQAVGEGSMLRRAVESGRVPSFILWGPPGCGKTTLAHIVAREAKATFVAVSAVSSGVADLRKVMAEAGARRGAGQRTVLFIDEIHRFNKAQQDVILPYVEDGTITSSAPPRRIHRSKSSRRSSAAHVSCAPRPWRAGPSCAVRRALTDPVRGLGERN